MKFRLSAFAIPTTIWLAAVVAPLVSPVQAQEATKLEETGLSLAPSDAAFYSSSLGLGKVWEREVTSGWVAEVRKVPYVQDFEAYVREQYSQNVAANPQVKAYAEGPIVQDLLGLLKDMVSNEIFIIGDKSWCDFAEQFGAFQNEMVAFNPETPEEVQEFVLAIEKAQVDAIKIPSTVIGFQLTEDTSARDYLNALEGLVRTALSASEELAPIGKALKRKDSRFGHSLSLQLKTDDIPWDKIPETDEKAGEAIQHLRSLLEGRSLYISLAVLNNRGFIAISEDPKLLENLGKGETLLKNETIQVLKKANPANLRGINYASAEWRVAGWEMSAASYFENLANQLSAPLMQLEADEDALAAIREKLVEDGAWLDGIAEKMQPKYGPMLGYSFDTDQGNESFVYDWTPSWLLENAQPLAVTRHAGKSPLLMAASRQKWIVEVNEVIEGVLEKIPGYIEAATTAGLLESEDAEKTQAIAEELLPIVSDLHDAIRAKIIPGLDGNESLLSVAAQWTTTQPSPYGPTADEPLPLPEIGLAMKLKNKDQFLSGLEDVFGALNKLINVGHELNPDGIPAGAAVPEPQEEQFAKGTRYFFPLGAEPPFDQCEFQMMVDDNVAVFGYSSRQVKAMFEDRALATRPAWYKANDPAASVAYVDVAGVFKAIKPWVRYSLTTATGDLSQPLGQAEAGAPVPTGDDVLQIWDCFRKLGKAAGTTVIDDEGVTVSHWLWTRD
ncbi:MAG: hypothetical protein U0892_21965 [Pirellulales bacterium]